MSAMITLHPHAPHRALLLAALFTTGLALAFLAGRVSVRAALARSPAPAAAREAEAAAARPPPWAESGFRDDESCELLGKSPDTN